MNILKIVIAGIVWAAVATSCATTSSSSGSNSNWLAVCSKDSDCGSGLECHCGVCTRTCTAAGECSGLATGATCDSQVTTLLCSGPAPEKACVLTCDRDSDCGVLGAQARCSGGLCTRSPSNGDGGLLTCTARMNAATAAVDPTLQAADTPANKTCAADEDCVDVHSVSCVVFCPGGLVLSRAGVDSLAPELAILDKELCDPFFAAGCQTPDIPCPNGGTPQCVGGTCVRSVGIGTGTCDDRTQQIGDRIHTLEGGHDRSCTKDADCTTFSIDISCYHACESGPLSASGVTAFSMDLATLEAELCLAFDAAGCTAVIPPCVPPLPVRCVASQCEIGTMP